MDIPRTINYDFLLVLTGFILLFLPFYYNFFSDNFEISIFLWTVGGIFFAMGISEVKYNYDIDTERKELNAAKEINEQIKYLKKEKLLDEKTENELLREIKDLIKKDE